MSQHDAEPSNEQRSRWAQTALDAFARTTNMDAAGGEDDETVLCKLLTDLKHWCDHNDVGFEAKLANSIGMYEEELAEEAARVMQ